MRRHVAAVATATAMVIGLVTAGSAAPAATPTTVATRASAAVAPVLTVTPSTDLLDTQDVEIVGSGFPAADVAINQCVVDAPCNSTPGLHIGADGTFDVLSSVLVRTDRFGPPGGDCVDLACEWRVSLGDGTVLARAPLSFRAGQTLPPLVTVTPNTGLRHDQTVLVLGDAFPAGAKVFLTECIQQELFCAETLQSTAVDADADGRFAAVVRVSRLLPDPPPGQRPYRDCATDLTPCTIQGVYAGTGGPTAYGSAPIRFDASIDPPGAPAVTLTPPRFFPAFDVAVFDLVRFTPARPVRARFCAQGRFTQKICDPWVTATSDPSGTAHVAIAVHRLTAAPEHTEIDCAGDGGCRVEAEGAFAYERASTTVGFDPTAPIPGRPTLALHDLTVTEGSDGGQTPARMRITLSEPASQPLTVGWSTDLVAPSQINPPGYLLTIPTGATEATLPLRVVADRTDEPDFNVPVGIAADGYTVTRDHATLRIVDDDPPSADPPAVAAIDLGDVLEGTPTARATVYLTAPAQHTVTVHYKTVDVSAVAGSDYVAKRSSVVFRPGEVRHVLRFEILDDHVREGREHFHVVITKVEGGIRARGNNVDIFDNDWPTGA